MLTLLKDKKNLCMIIGGLGLIIIIIIIALLSKGKRANPYEEVEKIMASAAEEFCNDNKDSLPLKNNQLTKVNVSTLVDGKYMKPLSKYTKNSTCDGYVVANYEDGDYTYRAYLTCDDYKTQLFVDKLKEDNAIKTTGDGLYDEDGLLRFRGEYVNNYLKIDDTLFRVVKIDVDNLIYVVLGSYDSRADDDRLYLPWDDRYNTEDELYSGINDYSLSRIKKSLEDYYASLDGEIKQFSTRFDACYTSRNAASTDNSIAIECSKKIENANIGLISLNDYIRASVANNCINGLSHECANYNYLSNFDSSFWTITGDSSSTSKVYDIMADGSIDSVRADSKSIARYVLVLKADTFYKEGNGTFDNPYIIR